MPGSVKSSGDGQFYRFGISGKTNLCRFTEFIFIDHTNLFIETS